MAHLNDEPRPSGAERHHSAWACCSGKLFPPSLLPFLPSFFLSLLQWSVRVCVCLAQTGFKWNPSALASLAQDYECAPPLLEVFGFKDS